MRGQGLGGVTRWAIALVAAATLFVGTALAAAPETARVGDLRGSATLRSGRQTSRVGSSTSFKAGDLLSVASGGSLTVRLADGATVRISGPAELSFLQLDSSGNRVMLRSGTISRADVGGVALEIQAPGKNSLVLQSASASASVAGSRVTFTKSGGDYAKLYVDGKAKNLASTWSNAPAAKPRPKPAPRPAVKPRPTPKPRPAVRPAAKPKPAPVSAVPASNEEARVGTLTGTGTRQRGTQTARVSPQTRFRQGDCVRLMAGARMMVVFQDSSSISVVGPAELCFLQLAPQGRRILLRSGVINEAYTRGTAMEIQTPYDASLILQNATGFARVAPGDKVSFQKLDGDLAQVWHKGKTINLVGGWTLNVRTGSSSGGDAPAGGRQRAGADGGSIEVGSQRVAYTPAGSFQVETTSTGGVILTYVGDDIGVVDVGTDAVFFLAPGESVELGADGNVLSFTGIVHNNDPVGGSSLYDEPVGDVSDVSTSKPGRR